MRTAILISAMLIYDGLTTRKQSDRSITFYGVMIALFMAMDLIELIAMI